MTTSRLSLLLASVALVAASACGSPTGDPRVGTYLMDVDRTLAANGAGKPADAALAAIRADFSPSAYRFEVLADGSFVLAVGGGTEPLLVQGSWVPTDGGMDLVTTGVNGGPADPETAALSLPCRFEDGALVLSADGKDIYLVRQ